MWPLDPVAEGWHGMSVNGHLTRSVLDTAILLDVTAGGGLAPCKPPAPQRPFADAARSSPGTLRIAVSPKVARALAPPMLDERCRQALDQTAELLRSLRHRIVWRDPDYGAVGNQVSVLYMRGIADDARALPHPERLGKHVRQLVRLGALFPDAAVRKARSVAKKHAARIHGIFDHCDVLLTPTIGQPPVPVGKWESRPGLWTLAGMTRRTGFTPPWNYLGNPAAAVPAGFTEGVCPCRCNWSVAPTTRRPCCRWPLRSRPSARGTGGARRSPNH